MLKREYSIHLDFENWQFFKCRLGTDTGSMD